MTVGPAESEETVEPAESEKTAGSAESEETVCSIRWADADAWEKLLRPAYTEIHGNYPEQKQEHAYAVRACAECPGHYRS